MRNGVLKILSSLLLVSSISLSFVGCNQPKTENKTTEQTEQNRPSRKPQVSAGNNSSNKESQTESIYKHGEILTLADGSKLKYDENGNHEILEKGEGEILIFKKVTEEQLSKLEPSQRTLVERQMKADPNGFSLIY